MEDDPRWRDLSLLVQEVRQRIGNTTIRRVVEVGRVASSLLGQATDPYMRDQLAHMAAALNDVVADLRSSVFLLSDAPPPSS